MMMIIIKLIIIITHQLEGLPQILPQLVPLVLPELLVQMAPAAVLHPHPTPPATAGYSRRRPRWKR